MKLVGDEPGSPNQVAQGSGAKRRGSALGSRNAGIRVKAGTKSPGVTRLPFPLQLDAALLRCHGDSGTLKINPSDFQRYPALRARKRDSSPVWWRW